MRTAVFLGAGASAAFGYPLTRDLLPRIRAGARDGTLFGAGDEARSEAAELAAVLPRILPGFDSVAELPLVTDVLSLLDHALRSDQAAFSRGTTADLARARFLLEKALFALLSGVYEAAGASPHLATFSDWLLAMTRDPADGVAVVSTNYDVAVDLRLFDAFRAGIPRAVDMGFAWRDTGVDVVHPRPADPAVRLLKLHGSLNWLRCDLCEHVFVNTRGIIAQHAFAADVNEYNTCWCGHAPLRALLVTPSMVREVRETNLLETWKAAVEAMRRAEEWVVVGYSFPPEDVAIRSLFLRAYGAREAPPRVRVVQKGDSAEVRARYEVLFPGCEYATDGLEGFLANARG